LSLDNIKRRRNRGSQGSGSSTGGGMHNQPFIVNTLGRELHEATFRGLIGREMHSGERRVHQHGGPIGGVERPKPFLAHNPLHAVPNPLVPAIPQLQPLLHHVHRRKHGVAGHGGADSRGSVRGCLVRAPLG